LFYVFRRFGIQKAGDASQQMVFTSTSLPLLLSFVICVAALILFICYLLKKRDLLLDISLAGAFVAFVLYGVQLASSQTLVSDFFGSLLVKTPVPGGRFIYQIADVSGISTGIGARLLVPLLVLSLICLAAVKLTDCRNKGGQGTDPDVDGLQAVLKEQARDNRTVHYSFYDPGMLLRAGVFQFCASQHGYRHRQDEPRLPLPAGHR
jgi:hypothetical protein